MRKAFFLAVFLWSFLLPSLATHAQMGEGRPSNRRSVTGNVYYADSGKPVENVLVELKNSEGLVVEQTMSGPTGFFQFFNLGRGSYEISIHVQGYEPIAQTVDLSFSSSRGNVLSLRPRRDPSGPAPSGSNVSAHELSMPEKARSAYEEGQRKLYQEKDAAAGLKAFQQAATEAPDFYEAYYQMGMAELSLDDFSAAEKDFQKSIEISKDGYAEADVALGSVQLDQNRNKEGEALIRHGLSLSPNSWLGLYELGRAQLNQNEVQEAAASAEKARQIQPNAPVIYRLLANVHIRQKNRAALLEDLNTYIKLEPGSAAGQRAQQMREQLLRDMAKGKGAGETSAAKP